MRNTFTFTQYRIPRLVAVTYRVTDAADRVLGFVLPFVHGEVVLWHCRTPYVPFAQLPGEHTTREAAAAHLAFLASLRSFRREHSIPNAPVRAMSEA